MTIQQYCKNCKYQRQILDKLRICVCPKNYKPGSPLCDWDKVKPHDICEHFEDWEKEEGKKNEIN